MPQRRRRRRESIAADRRTIVDRVTRFYRDDVADRSTDREMRLQRYAKYRMWVEGKDWPWQNASDVPLPDMTEKSLRVQDTLHNAVMSQRPPISSKARNRANRQKQETVDQLIDFQFFVEQPGEAIVGDLAEQFVNDGVFTAFIPWVHEFREGAELTIWDPLPDELEPVEYFTALLRRAFPGAGLDKDGRSDWDWFVDLPGSGDDMPGTGERLRVRFYTAPDDRIEMSTLRRREVYNGPRVIPKEYDDVHFPVRAANLQIPGPSNPGGAAHVILRDYPTRDEIRRLKKSGFYDLATDEDMDKLDAAAADVSDAERESQKDDLAGVTANRPQAGARSHGTMTRLICFDMFDIDGDGHDEDVIFWVILETGTLLKAKLLTEMFPANPPRRPFAESPFLPVPGRRAGISLLEQLEGLHDVFKQTIDQSVDAGTLANAPFFFYRAAGGLKPEVIRLWPGEGYPLTDPQRDVEFPQIGNQQAQGFSLNLMALVGQMEERVSMIGDLQFGRVPPGKSSALRTIGGMALLSGQGEARPERILRRFFMGLTEIWRQMHELNRAFLPKNKQIRIAGLNRTSEDPYLEIQDRTAIEGRFDFDFSANVLNTSKENLQQSLLTLASTFINDLTIQLGIVTPNNIYRLLRDIALANGQDPDNRYLTEPSPDVNQPRLFAEEAISTILSGSPPAGVPAEPQGAGEHLEKLVEFMQSDRFGLLGAQQVDIFRGWLEKVREQVALEQKRARLAEAARQFASAAGQGRPGAPETTGPPDPNEQTPVSAGNELLDESLPTAGGGGNRS